MKFKPVKLAPVLITVAVLLAVCLLRLLNWDFIQRLERITYDQRVRLALNYPKPVATNLAAVYITDDSLAVVEKGSKDYALGYQYGINWPRHVYGRALREASTEGARAVAFDILFGERRHEVGTLGLDGDRRIEALALLAKIYPDQEQTTITNNATGEVLSYIESDDHFTWQLNRSHRAILAAMEGVLPLSLFATNATEIGDISAERDADGVLRRARAFRDYRRWHPYIVESLPQIVDLEQTRMDAGEIRFFTKSGKPFLAPDGKPFALKMNTSGEFDFRPLVVEEVPASVSPWLKPFETTRVWHMGIVLAAQGLGLQLTNAEINLEQGRITFHGGNGVKRVLPVDHDGFFDINWELTATDERLTILPIEQLLKRDGLRSGGQTNGLTDELKGKLAVIGSSATGNNMTDRGATPLVKDTFLVSKHWNVANSILTGRFVQRASLGTELLAIILLGALTAFLTWQVRIHLVTGGVLFLAALYLVLAFYLYVEYRYWLPIVLPLIGALVVEHVSLVTYRVVVEQAERRRVKSHFSQVVSPNIVDLMLDMEKLSIGGARREVTVFFADVRGFTELTDANQEKAEAYVRDHKLSEEAARAFYDEQAHETLNTINFYLALVADLIKKHDGTLDKFIGDCVMAFWGEPTPNPKHALACVRTAIDAQRAIYEVNQRRTVERQKLELENRARESAGLTPKPLPPILSLGTGINTGEVTVGFMGSEAHIRNFTVFGREVNLASRLEGVSGHGRIVIGERTYQHLLRDDPALAARCIELEPTRPKGFKNPVRVYEVPWLPDGVTKTPSTATLSTATAKLD